MNKTKKDFSVQVSKKHYFNPRYDSRERWISYWYQINEVMNQKPLSVLEIGIGNRTVSDYLNKMGIKTITCDIDKSLKPDVVGSVLNLPFRKNSFDLVLCAEVLEHLPFNQFSRALKEIHKTTKKSAVLTLPHFSITNLYLGAKIIPFVPKKTLSLKIDIPIEHKFSGEHYWEIGKKGFPLEKVQKRIKDCHFKILKSFYPPENPYHHFFTLVKTG